MPIIVESTAETGALVLTRLWLNLVSNDTIYRSFRLASFTPDDGARVEVRVMANGVERLIRRAGGVKTVQAVLRHPTAEDRDWLGQYVGEPVWVRDPDGGKFPGVYPNLQRSRMPGPVGEDITLAFRRVSSITEVV